MTTICSIQIDALIGGLRTARNTLKQKNLSTSTQGVSLSVFSDSEVTVQKNGEDVEHFSWQIEDSSKKPVSDVYVTNFGPTFIDSEKLRYFFLTKGGKTVVFEEL